MSQVWEATLATFAAKFVVSATFVIPVIFAPLDQAIVISVAWGLLLLTVLSFFIARAQGIATSSHRLCVVAMTHAVGDWVKGFVGEE